MITPNNMPVRKPKAPRKRTARSIRNNQLRDQLIKKGFAK